MRVCILGYGKMGRGIYNLFSATPMEIVVYEVMPEKVEEGTRTLEKRLRRAVRQGLIREEEMTRRMREIRFTSSLDDVRGCDLAIECAPENFDLKMRILQDVEPLLAPNAILTSNTSGLSITKMGESLRHPERFCGYHFFHPVQLTTIVEIIEWARVAPTTVDVLKRVSGEIQRTPLVVKDVPGSVINVILSCHYCEALYMLEEGVALPSQLDALSSRFCRIGPCESVDVIGIPFFTESLARMLKFIPVPFTVPDICHKLIADGRNGKQAGRGLYLYVDDRPTDDSAAYYRNPKQTHNLGGYPADEQAVLDRLYYSFYFAVAYLASMGLADIETLCVALQDLVGMSGDPLAEVRRLGGEGLRRIFERFARELGPRYDPTPMAGFLAKL